MRTKKKEKSKSLNLGFYFGLFVFLIIVISLFFKTFDVIKKSKFDGKNRFTVAVINKKSTDLISTSPVDGTLSALHIDGISSPDSLKKLSLPIDAYAKTDSSFSSKLNYYFAKILFNKRSFHTSLTIIDLVRLSIYSSGVDNQKIRQEGVSINNQKELMAFSSTLFVDPAISEEKVSIQITNATDVVGLGNRLTKYIANMGGNVVLVNSSKDAQSKSRILYQKESYTVKKISEMLGIEREEKKMNSISDIIIIIGKDKQGI